MKRLYLLCLCLLPFLLNAQFKTNLTIKAIPGLTETKILIPIGFEVQPNASFGILGEINIPVNRRESEGYDGSAFKAGFQVRKYYNNETKFRQFWGLDLSFRTEQYFKNNSYYYPSSNARSVDYYSARIKSNINTVGLHLGGQRAFSNRFVFEWNVGAGIATKNVRYYNVVRKPTVEYESVADLADPSVDMYGIGEFLGNLTNSLNQDYSSSSSKKDKDIFKSFSDQYKKRGSNLTLFGNLKIGYLLVK